VLGADDQSSISAFDDAALLYQRKPRIQRLGSRAHEPDGGARDNELHGVW